VSRTPEKRRGGNKSRSRSASQQKSRSVDSKRDKRSVSPRADNDMKNGSDEKPNGIQQNENPEVKDDFKEPDAANDDRD